MKIQVHLIYQKEKYNWVMVAYVRRQTDPCEVRPAHSTEQVLGQVLHRKQKSKKKKSIICITSCVHR